MVKRTNPLCTVACILALLNVIFVPVFDVWGGLIPSDPTHTFTEVIEMVAEDAEQAFDLWVVLFTMKIFIPSLIALLFALSYQYVVAKISAGVGLFLVVVDLGRFADQNDYEWGDFFADDTSVSIGVWVALILFLVILFSGTGVKKEENNTEGQTVGTAPTVGQGSVPLVCETPKVFEAPKTTETPKTTEEPTVSQAPQTPRSVADSIDNAVKEETVTQSVSNFKCPNCGQALEGNEKFCAMCGQKLV